MRMKQLYQTSLLGILAVCGVGGVQGESLWAAGISARGGWYDFNKDPRKPESKLCWAITASNLLAWWQDNAISNLPEEIPTGKGVWEAFRTAFTDNGCDPDQGIRWWISGRFEPRQQADGAVNAERKDPDSGGFYKSRYREGEALYEALLNVGRGAAVTAESISKAFYEGFRAGDAFWIGVGYTRPDGVAANHSLNVWGIEYEMDAGKNPRLTALYMTDSDDGATKLHRIPLKEEDGKILFDCSDHPLYGSIGRIVITNYTGVRLRPNLSKPLPVKSEDMSR